VRVLQRQRVGVFDTVTLTAKDPTALTTWLTTNGFATPTNAGPVIADYVKQGWVFVAARVARATNTTEPTSPHPLSFTFKTREPVYPLRLTGVDNGLCTIDLDVFGPQRAELTGFRVKRCARPTYHEVLKWPRIEGGEVRVRHAELARLVNGAPVATKLTVTLAPAHMKRDAHLRWVPYRLQGAVLYRSQAAVTLAANVASFLLLLSALGTWFGYRLLTHRSAARVRCPVATARSLVPWGFQMRHRAIPPRGPSPRHSASAPPPDLLTSQVFPDFLHDRVTLDELRRRPSGDFPPQPRQKRARTRNQEGVDGHSAKPSHVFVGDLPRLRRQPGALFELVMTRLHRHQH
jgi:hypothetical protein